MSLSKLGLHDRLWVHDDEPGITQFQRAMLTIASAAPAQYVQLMNQSGMHANYSHCRQSNSMLLGYQHSSVCVAAMPEGVFCTAYTALSGLAPLSKSQSSTQDPYKMLP